MSEPWAGAPVNIRTPDQKLRVFVSSTMKELSEERRAAREAITRLRLSPVLFETGARPHPPRDLYRAYLEQSDIFIGIYWEEYGWVAPGMDISGLEDEYRLAGERPRLIYVKAPAPKRQEGLQKLLNELRTQATISYRSFASADELRELIENDLSLLLTERFESVRAEPPAMPAARFNNLPRQRRSLLGREAESERLQEYLRRTAPHDRLATITGPGGIGKSRLALHVAASLSEHFREGVVYVSLQPLNDPGLVPAAIAAALGLQESAGRGAVEESVKDFLRDKEILLLIDNFEQVIAAAPAVAELIETCPQLKILVTSRMPLRVRGEQEFPLGTLSLPTADAFGDELPGPEALLDGSAAVRLFVERARDVRPEFALNAANAAAVARICVRLDGLPLAIELAAARIRILSPQALLARLDRRLELLRGGARDLPARQQTMREAIAWSYDLLDEGDRILFRRLSTFRRGINRGAFTLRSLSELCAPLGTPLTPHPAQPEEIEIEIMDGLSSLVDKSLLYQAPSAAPDAEPRFGLLGMVREFAQEALEGSGEAYAVRRQHAQIFVELARAAEPHLNAPQRGEWLTRLEHELDNLRAALEWTLGEGADPRAALEIAGSLTWFWFHRGRMSEGRRWMEAGLGRAAQAGGLQASLERGKALCGAGGLAWAQGDYESAANYLDQGVALFRAANDGYWLARALAFRGLMALSRADSQLARTLCEESLSLSQQTGHSWNEAFAERALGDAALLEQQLDEARTHYARSQAIWRSLGDTWGQALVLNDVGRLASLQSKFADARAAYLEGAELLRQLDDRWGLAMILVGGGHAAMHDGDHQAARASFRESLDIWRRLGNKTGIIQCLVGLAGVLNNEGQTERAARLLGAADALYRDIGFVLDGASRLEYERQLTETKQRLSGQSFANQWQEGQRLSLDRSVELALLAPSAS
jgi:predicted ATPase